MTVVGLDLNRLPETLTETGLVEAGAVEKSLKATPAQPGEALDKQLLRTGVVDKETLLHALAVQKGLPFVRMMKGLGDPETLQIVDRDWARSHGALPLYRVGDTLTVAIADPTDVFTIEALARLTGLEIRLVVCPSQDIEKGMAQLGAKPDGLSVHDILEDVDDDEEDIALVREDQDEAEDLEEIAGLSPVVRLVNRVIRGAISHGASDIHIEPDENTLGLRFRIDGMLRPADEIMGVTRLPTRFAPAIVSRVKIMAGLDIAERRIPQDGRIPVNFEGRAIDLRVSTLPTGFGEKVVMRILDRTNMLRDLTSLGLSERIQAGVEDIVSQPNGVMLVTGPTGSGKTTTLYAALAMINSVDRNICTVEDPTEYTIPMINQIQVNERAGLTFTTALRAILRQDPDVIMVGEVRDRATAQIAIEAALTGHLVFSTLHTNDAIAAVPRLVNMGIEAYLLAAALNAVLSQRLVRRVCESCKVSVQPTEQERVLFDRHAIPFEGLARGEGCSHCAGTGYVGRVGIHELFVIDDAMRDLITTDPTLTSLRNAARKQGHVSIGVDGLWKAAEGLTTTDEVLRLAEIR
ncbi:MAG: GspE/PulE family protein [Planctomycetota bacterium]|nr:GspE/PulE family protein [Planctomycetota bacterium]